ncbi:hypothetical protein T06_4997, partial [Trichinella sp. T6]
MRVSPMKKKVEIRRSALKKKMDHLERLWRENALHLELRLHLQEIAYSFTILEAEDAEIESDIWAGLRNRFLSLRAHVESSMAAKEQMDLVSHEGRKVCPSRFELPKFDGDVTRFREFWDQFEASFHQQTDLSDATKMAYLRGCLTGVALDALEGLVTRQRLKGRFDRPQVAVRQHILWFFHTLSKSIDPSAICDECHRGGVYSLTALGKDPRNGGLSAAEVMIAVARARLPNSVRVQWDKLTMENGSLVADLPGFLRFLQEQVELADTTRRTRELRLEDKQSENASTKQGSCGKGRETQKTVAFFHSAVEAVCGFCQKQHTIAECASLKQASRQKQREMATRYRLCFYCLKPGHVSSACKSDCRRKSPASKDSSAVVSVGTTTTERVQETPTVECKSSSVLMMHANLASEKRGKINRFQTIKAIAFGDAGSGITVTCLLDTGAEYSFIREDVASALGVVGRAQPVKVERFGGATHEHPSSQVVQLWLGRLDGSQNAERYPLEALTVPSLCNQIPVSKTLTSVGRNWEIVQRHLASERVEWIFITERSPWCGGYWERLVRSVKTALKATLGQCLVAPDELRTVLCEVEARVNDRPLTFVGSDLDEEMALTPAHFLIGRSLASFPDRSNSAHRGIAQHLLRRWSYQQKLVGAFWKRWKREYVVTLSSRGKWK